MVESSGGRQTVAVPSFQGLVRMYTDQYTGADHGTRGRLDFWISRFGDKPVIDITEFDVGDGLIELATRPARGKKRPLTGSSINRYKITLSTVFILCGKLRRRGLLRRPPANRLRLYWID
jgi:hypothetical protein